MLSGISERRSPRGWGIERAGIRIRRRNSDVLVLTSRKSIIPEVRFPRGCHSNRSRTWIPRNKAGRRTLASHESAEGEFAGHGWTHGHTSRRELFSPVSVRGQKPYAVLLFQKPLWRSFHDV